MHYRNTKLATLAGAVLILALSACSAGTTAGSASSGPTSPGPSTTRSPTPTNPPATEFNPPGDIPDSQVFVDYRVPSTSVRVQVPEGWARSTRGGETIFTDNFNSVAIRVIDTPVAPTVASVRSTDIPALAASTPRFEAGQVSEVQLAGGRGVLVKYLRDSAPDPVTNKVVRDAVERYLVWSRGREAILTLTGPQGADNVDPWRLISNSLAFS